MVKILEATTNGAAAGCPPKNIKIKNVATNKQNVVIYKVDLTGGIVFIDNLKNGRINKTKIPDNIPITPPNLLGHALKIA